jgi:hypothetical protein
MEQASPNPAELIRPIVALVALTGIVWVLMVVVRNTAVFRGTASIGYYRGYTGNAPPEWIERPARAFMNLLEVPVLFYLVCVLMLVTQRFDSTQVGLAWTFVAIRAAHAAIHIGWNDVRVRFAAYLAGCLVLAGIWMRFALALA